MRGRQSGETSLYDCAVGGPTLTGLLLSRLFKIEILHVWWLPWGPHIDGAASLSTFQTTKYMYGGFSDNKIEMYTSYYMYGGCSVASDLELQREELNCSACSMQCV